MSKRIHIKDKSAVSRILKKDNIRTVCGDKKWDCVPIDFFDDREKQLAILEEMYSSNCLEKNRNLSENVGDTVGNTLENTVEKIDRQTLCREEIRKKITSYRGQDTDKTKYELNDTEFITYDYVLELLAESKLQCYYCRKDIYILYKKVRQNNQWTIDRIDNDIGHNKNNCVISCLRCNIQRRLTNEKKFLFTKQMRIVKRCGDVDAGDVGDDVNYDHAVACDNAYADCGTCIINI